MSYTVGYLGPRGTFTEAALGALSRSDIESVPYPTVAASLDAVRKGDVSAALVPFENSIEGSVSQTLDDLATGEPLVIVEEVAINVNFALMVRPGTKLEDFRLVTSHPVAFPQCRNWLSTALPDVQFVPAASNAAAAEAVSDPASHLDAAIAASVAASHYGLDVIAHDIADNQDAVLIE